MPVNLEGLKPVRTSRYGGQVDWDDPIQIPNGLAILCQNMQFLAESVKQRWGLRQAMVFTGAFLDPTGIDVLTVLGSPQAPTVKQQAGGGTVSANSLNPNAIVGNNVSAFLAIAPNTQVSLAFGDNGKLYLELPAGSENLVALPSTRIATALAALLPASSAMQTTKAYNRIYQAYAELMNRAFPASSGPVLTLDASTGFESPVGQNPIAAAWQANTFYEQGDLVTPTASGTFWFRRLNTGFSGATEPNWLLPNQPANFFASGYVANPFTVTDGGSTPEWQEWTPGFPSFLPQGPRLASAAQVSHGGTISAGLDVYIYLSYFNDLGEGAWSSVTVFENTVANEPITCLFQGVFGVGPFMPAWLLSVTPDGDGIPGHWPSSTCINVYVNAVTHGNPAPTQFYLAFQTTADNNFEISSIPVSGTLFNVRTAPTAAISAQQFMGEPGQRYAMLLRQNTMGDLSPADPNDAIPVQFGGGSSQQTIAISRDSSGNVTVAVPDITQFAPGSPFTIGAAGDASLNGSYIVASVQVGGVYPYPGGFITAPSSHLTAITIAVGGQINTAAGPCPIAVLPPGSQEGPGYSYDIVAFTVVGIGPEGPFFYLASANPANPFSTGVVEETTDGNGNALAIVNAVDGLAPGDSVLIAGWTGGNAGLNGLRVLATVGSGVLTVSFPDPAGGSTEFGAGAVSMTLVQTEPTQAVAGLGRILLQFDDTTLPEGVDVTGNLLFVALPPCTDLAYLPSVTRMAYVSDLFPTTLIFSEEDFMGEVDGLNDVLAIEASNGAPLVGARELLNGTIIACKQTGGYQIVPTDDVPARWGVSRLWGVHGPVSGRGIATGRDGSTGLNFLLFVDPESGLHKWPPTLGEGQTDWLSRELSGANNQDASRMATWDRVNRAAAATIQVVVDDIAKEVKIAAPLDGATSPSHILTMSYFNGWADPLLLTLSGEWVPNRGARRWNIDPIATNCMALVKRTLATPVDQRVNYQQLLLGVPTFLPSSYATIVSTSFSQPAAPTIPPGTYYAQLAKVTGGNETAYTPVLGPFTVSVSGSGPFAVNTFQADLPGDGLEDSWTIYFGTSPTSLTKKITGISKSVSIFNVTTAGVSAAPVAGFSSLAYMQPGAYDDLGGGYNARYRPAYVKEMPNQEWPDGERVLRFSAITGRALGAGQMLITPITDDPNYQPDPKQETLGVGLVEVPGSAPITHFSDSLKGDSKFLTCEFSNGGVPGTWFQLLENTLWYSPLQYSK